MKMTLILLALIPLAAFAAQKKPELRQGNKTLGDRPPKLEETFPQESHAGQDRTQQLEAKGTRQFQEEDLRERK